MEVIRESLEPFRLVERESVYLAVDDIAVPILFRIDGGSTSAAPDRVRVPLFIVSIQEVAHRHVAVLPVREIKDGRGIVWNVVADA